MKVKALRGVCIGIERHLAAGEIADLTDASLLTFLVSIKAVELVKDEPPPAAEPEPEVKATPAKAGKSKEK